MKKLIKVTALLLGGLFGLVLLAGLALYPIGLNKLNRTYPEFRVETVNIPNDPEAIARGRHIAILRKCMACHGEDLSGAMFSEDPFLGTIPAPNLTSGSGGIASSYTVSDWVRAIRHGVKPGGHAEVFMYNYWSMSDQDLGDLIAYLQQVHPVDAEPPEMSYGMVLPILHALGMLTPAAAEIAHEAPRPADPARGATIEYGQYLAAICFECHSTRLAGQVREWRQEDFIHAIQTGILPDGEPFSSSTHTEILGELDDTELTALWLYLQSLPIRD